jgi:hypothetical protein
MEMKLQAGCRAKQSVSWNLFYYSIKAKWGREMEDETTVFQS